LFPGIYVIQSLKFCNGRWNNPEKESKYNDKKCDIQDFPHDIIWKIPFFKILAWMWDIISFYSDSFAIPVLSYFIKRSVTK
jgi:hypothetical protein